MKNFALIVGGGQGLRFGGDVPKQFQLLNGRPILFRSIDLFYGLAHQVVVVIPATQFDLFNELQLQHRVDLGTSALHLVAGGDTRTESVRNGLKALSGEGIVAIHDAVRPLATRTLIQRLYEDAAKHASAIPVVPMRDSLRELSNDLSRAVNREQFVAVQTPQCFDLLALQQAYTQHAPGSFTDDASLFESTGKRIHLSEGENRNIKITWPEDMLFAESILKAGH